MISDMKNLCPHFGRIIDLLMGALPNPRGEFMFAHRSKKYTFIPQTTFCDIIANNV